MKKPPVAKNHAWTILLTGLAAWGILFVAWFVHPTERGHHAARFAAAVCTLKHGTMVAGICISNDAILDGKRCVMWIADNCTAEVDRNGLLTHTVIWKKIP